MNKILDELKLSDKDENSLLNNLTKIPKKEPRDVMPYTYAVKAFVTEQADLLFLPNDNGYRYLLVVVDISTRTCDAEPLKSKESESVKKALIKIFKRGIIKQPKRLEVDAGSEFKGAFKAHYDKVLHILTKVSGRHRQQSVVETKNHQIGTILNKRMLAEEINNDATSRHWVDILPKVIKLINKYYAHEPKKVNPNLPPKIDKFSEDVLDIGTRVRVQLDNPKSYIEGKTLHGKFRASDLRWSKEIHKVTDIYLRPNQPVMYGLDNSKQVAYTKYQLQVLKDNERLPSTENQKQFYAQKILSKRKVKGKVYYTILWEDGDKTEMDYTQAKDEIPDLLNDYNKSMRSSS